MVLLAWLSWGTKGGIGYLLPQHQTTVSSFSPKLNATFRTMRGHLQTWESWRPGLYLIILIWLLSIFTFFVFWILFLYNFWSRPIYSNMLLLWFLVIPWGPLYRWKSNLWQLAEFLLGGNSLVPHDLLKRSWLWKQMRDNQLTLSDMGPEVFSSERVLKSLPGGR